MLVVIVVLIAGIGSSYVYAYTSLDQYLQSFYWRIDYERCTDGHWRQFQTVQFRNGSVYNQSGSAIIGSYHFELNDLQIVLNMNDGSTHYYAGIGYTADIVAYSGSRYGLCEEGERMYMRRMNAL